MYGAPAVELLFLTPAITPYSPGPVGDVCAALPKALRGAGHRVTVVAPLPKDLDPVAHSLARRLSKIPVEVGKNTHECVLFDGRTTGGVDLVFVGSDGLLEELEGAAGARAALGFAQAALEVIRTREPAVELLHAHGWFAAPALALAREALPALPRVLSLHDPDVQGKADPADLAALGLPDTTLLSLGATCAQRVVVDSEQLARSLAGAEDARGLAAALAGDGADRMVAIPNGLDGAYWNPSTDAHLPSRFDPATPERKARCKQSLQAARELPVRAQVPLLALIDPSAAGAALIAEIAEQLLGNDVQVVVAGCRHDAPASALEGLAERYPERLSVLREADEAERHRALGGADLSLIPDEASAAGQLHLAAQRYGALPVVRPVGALAEAVVDCDASLTTGNGFVAGDDDAQQYLSAAERGVAACLHRGLPALRARVMSQDVSWERSARRYEYLYKSLLKP